MTRSFLLSALMLVFGVVMTGCATVAPEDLPRLAKMTWNLTPDENSTISKTVRQGDVVLSWDAAAEATHETRLNDKTIPLVLTATKLGNLYCSNAEDGDRCYEDRDGDARLDYVWEPYRDDKTLTAFNIVSKAKPLEIPLNLRVTADGQPLIRRRLAMIYDGPIRGLIGAADDFELMIGAMALGWVEDGVSRLPNGDGLSRFTSLSMIVLSEDNKPINYEALGLSMTPRGATVDGKLTLGFRVKSVENVDVLERFKADIGETPDFDSLPAPAET